MAIGGNVVNFSVFMSHQAPALPTQRWFRILCCNVTTTHVGDDGIGGGDAATGLVKEEPILFLHLYVISILLRAENFITVLFFFYYVPI